MKIAKSFLTVVIVFGLTLMISYMGPISHAMVGNGGSADTHGLFAYATASDIKNVKLTDKGTIKVGLATDPAQPMPQEETKLNIDFIKKDTEAEIQEHIDYKIFVKKRGGEENLIVDLIHTSSGSITVPHTFAENASYEIRVDVLGILFQPMPAESAIFSVQVGKEEGTNSNKAEGNNKGNDSITIPDWVRNNAGWWSKGQIGDKEFASGIQYMIKNGIINVPVSETQGNKEKSGVDNSKDITIPDWVRNNAGWWSKGQIGDKEFASGIQYMIKNEIISV